MAVPARIRATMRRLNLRGVNKPKRTPGHKTKSHVVMASSGGRYKVVRFGQQGVKWLQVRTQKSKAHESQSRACILCKEGMAGPLISSRKILVK